MKRALLPIALLLAAFAAEVIVWRADWTTDTDRHPSLKNLRVSSGRQLSLERSNSEPDQPIVDYQMPAQHSHRVHIYMKRARLGDQTQAAFQEIAALTHQHAPAGNGVLDFGPDPAYEQIPGEPCQVHVTVAYASAQPSQTVLLYPQPKETADSAAQRVIHLQSSSELAVQFSANSRDGRSGPRCRGSLSMTNDVQRFQAPLGKDLQWVFVAAPNSDVSVIFEPDLWRRETDEDFVKEMESLTLQKVQPLRLGILPVGESRVLASRARSGNPTLTADSVKLGPDFLDIGLEGRMIIPIREWLAGWQWAALFATIDLSLLLWSVLALRKRERVFLSYSRADEGSVMQVYDLLEKAGGKPWIDRRNILGGVIWRELIKRQMRRSKNVLVFLTDHSLKTGGYFWMEMEVAVSLAEHRRGESFLIPLKLEDCELPEVLIPYQTLSLHEPGGRERLLEALGLPISAASKA